MTQSTRVLLVDDHPVVLAGCRLMLGGIRGCTTAEARDANSAYQEFLRFKPHVTVIDVNLAKDSGLDLAKRMLETDATARIIIFTMSDAPLLALQAIDIGARGFVSKTDEAEELRNAVVAILNGEQWISADLIQEMALMRASSFGSALALSERETAILRALVRGRSLAEIATDLKISYKTAATYCASLRTKLNARTTSELVRIAIEMRLT